MSPMGAGRGACKALPSRQLLQNWGIGEMGEWVGVKREEREVKPDS